MYYTNQLQDVTDVSNSRLCASTRDPRADRFATFQVVARDKTDQIARGIHKRRVIDIQRFAKRVARKQQAEE